MFTQIITVYKFTQIITVYKLTQIITDRFSVACYSHDSNLWVFRLFDTFSQIVNADIC